MNDKNHNQDEERYKIKDAPPSLFNSDDFSIYKEEWKDMPEFTQNRLVPYAQIIFRFSSKEDLENFSELIGQKLTKKTKSAWFPFRSHWGSNNTRWIDEEQ